MGLQVVHDDDITAMQRRSQTLFDIGQEPRSVHCSIDHEGCNHSVVTQAGYQSDGLPMPLWDVSDQPLAAEATAPEPQHIGAGGGLVDEHQSGGVKQALLSDPSPACPGHVRSFLLRRA